MVTVRKLNRLLLISFILTIILSSISLIAQNPVGIWKLNEGSGDVAYDSSGGGHAAALSSGIQWSKTANAWTISADGTHRGYVTTPALDLTATKAVTVTLWVKRTSSITSGGTVLFGAGKDYLHSETGFALLADDDTCHGLQAVLHGNEGTAANCYAQPSTGGWHHFAVVYDKSQTGGSAVSLYIDGALQTPTWNLSSATNTNNFGADPVYLMSRGGSSQYSSGKVSDFRIYDGALSGDQVEQIYNDTMLASPASISYVQGNYKDPMSSQTSVTVPFTAAQIAGDLNVVVVGWKDSNTSVRQITDSKGNTYVLAVGPTRINGTASQSIYYAKNIVSAGAGSNSVTVTFSASARNPDIRILEYSGADTSNPLDVTAANTGSGTSANSGSATTTNPTDLILGADLVQSITSGPGTGFTKRVLSSPQGNIAEDQTTTTTGRYAAAASLMPASRWIMQMAAFRGQGSPTLSSITVTPSNPSILVGGRQQFTATGNYSDGSHQDLTSSATWTSSSPSIATITSTGLATGVAAGSTTIKAASGSIYGTTTLTVTAASNFTISASPSSVSVAQGHQGTSTITTTGVNGFNSSIALSATGAPSGTSVAFNPTTIPAPGSGTSIMTITVGSSTPVGTYPITVIGNGGGIQQPTTVTLTVTAASTGISLDGNVHGVHDNYTNASNTASLLIGTPTAGDLITCGVTLDSGNGNTLVSVSDNHNGTYAAAVPVHLNGSLVQWYGLYYAQNVSAAATTITITTTQSRPYLAISCQAWKGAATSGVLDSGFSQFQDGVSLPNPTTGGSRMPGVDGELVISALGPATAGTPTAGSRYTLIDGAPQTQLWPEYWVQTTATSTNGNYTWPTDTWTDAMAAFRPAGATGNFTISASPGSITVAQGNQGTSTITTAVSGGFNSSISLSATGAPTGTTVAFSPTTIPAPGSGTSVMTVTVGANTPTGTYSITVTGNGGGIQQTTVLSLTVSAGSSFSISASPGSLSVMQGTHGTSTLTTTVSGGFNSSISLAATGAPTGVTVTFNPTTIPAPGSGTSIMTMTVSGTTHMGSYPITVTATGGGIHQTTTVTLTVTAQIALSWTASQSPGTAGYNIYRSTTSGGEYNRINTSLNTTTSYNDQQVADGVMYYYVTTAVDGQGLESVYSNQASAMVP